MFEVDFCELFEKFGSWVVVWFGEFIVKWKAVEECVSLLEVKM